MIDLLAAAGYVLPADVAVWRREGYDSIDYSDGDSSEDGLLATLRAAADVSVFSSDLVAACVDWPSRYHLSTERANLLRPFAQYLQPGARVLEIGAGCGAVTRYLGESGADVLALEGSLRRASIARERTRELGNVAVVAERFQDFSVAQRFDVVTLIGVLEYASLFSDAQNPALHMLQVAKQLLAPGGRLILAIENQLGLKYLAGVPEDHLGQPMVGLEDRYQPRGARTYGRNELDALLQRAGYARSRFSAPLPDYKMPATILTGRGISADPVLFNVGALASQAVLLDPQLTPTTFNLQRAWPVVAANGLALDLANSFLVEAVADDAAMAEQTALAYHYSTQRLGAYARETVFVAEQGQSVRVHARRLSDAPAADGGVRLHVERDMEYLQGPLLVDGIRAVLSQPGWTQADLIAEVRRYLQALAQVLHDEGHAIALDSVDSVLPDDYLDATPSNLLCTADGRIVYFDREWVVERPTLGWLLLRSLLFTYGGSVVAPMAAGEPIMLRTLLLDVVAGVLARSANSGFDLWLERELAFQRQVTGKDQREAIDNMLDAPVPHAAAAVAAAGRQHVEIADGFASLQHALNLAGQHSVNMHASIEALHTALGDSLAQTVPALQRIEAVVQQLAEGQGALHDRIVATDDRLVDSIRRWSTQQAELTGRLSGALDRMERYAALEAKMDALAAVQGQQMDMLAQLLGSRWWKLRR
ncbi:class I SAM-dependent methyltransferase [Xanthomonas translucens]|uniref:tRNA methyltransferase n=2 Tax=Xanthomonas campestris pv. translucens TaxID=343 RepID=A0A109HKC7_XANCT|nr:class I SAM-dependent methyltransferase [Xanthomonas translucens]KTF39536.1 tRNA (mo5U34)-methyltransferase [Xanthomonas translucens pv. translucens]KWV13795.1 tRNA methyltransferase [Xanthomonas translucens]MCS3359505.1 class I SAM-dependent methyltransferase [Xanthomonas translucens pv. translucens]MCS3372063.1 class I SAM-dependent methyltransferase [Xanthomonas translucens pv. translucens]MCT8272969.1 class I SAM-dependent methyltransferase [Xanthomonas translucens pv. translucens]